MSRKARRVGYPKFNRRQGFQKEEMNHCVKCQREVNNMKTRIDQWS